MRRWVVATKSPQERLYGSHESMKRSLAKQASHRCVYCGITVARNGSDANFEIEHFRPESVMTPAEREAGEHINPYNLLYACSQCNRIKADDWPGPPDNFSAPVHVNPSRFDYHDLMHIDPQTWEVMGKCTAGTYIAVRLGLNREQLVHDRRADHVLGRVHAMIDVFSGKIDAIALSGDLVREMVVLLAALAKVLHRFGSEGLLDADPPLGAGKEAESQGAG